MNLSVSKISAFLVSILALFFLYSIYQFFVKENVYPYAFLALLELLSMATFIVPVFFDKRFSKRLQKGLLLLAILNSGLLFSFSIYPMLLKTLWNISFGLILIYPVFFMVQFVYKQKGILEQMVFYLTLLLGILFEIALLFKIIHGWYYMLLTATLLLETILFTTLSVFRFKRNVKERQ
jgi:hypothetical protein